MRVNQRRIFARTFVSFVYFDAICKSNNIVMLKLLFIIFFQRFINVVSRFPPPEDSRLPLFPLPPPVTFLPCSRPPVFPPPPPTKVRSTSGTPTHSRFFVADKKLEDSRQKNRLVCGGVGLDRSKTLTC